jgi:hypothetical protein
MDSIDEEEIKNTGTYSVRLPWSEIRANVYPFFQNSNPTGDAGAFRRARTRLMKTLPFRSLRLASLDSAFDKMPKGTNLGAPTFSNDKKFAKMYLERAKSITSADDLFEFVVFWRGQPNGTPVPKQRTVMGGDHLDTILWERILIPLLDVLRKVPGNAAWNDPDYVDLAITELLEYAGRNKLVIVSGDQSKYDAHLSAPIINVVFDFLESVFQASDSFIINVLREHFLHGGLICPDGILTGRNGAVMSGSGGTNPVDGLGNQFASYYVAEAFGCELARMEVMGDDFVDVFTKDVLDDLEEIMESIGLVVNKEKQFVSDRSCHYLQRWHSLDYKIDGICRGVRSPFRALNGMMSRERTVSGWNEMMDSVRWYMQGEMVRWDKRFVPFVKLMKEGDRVTKAGIDPYEVVQRAGGTKKVRRVLRIQSFPFNVKEPEGIDKFAITKVLRSLM